MRMTLFIACLTFGLGSTAVGQQSGRVPTTAPPIASIVRGGVLQGYVFWPTSAAQYNPVAPCSSLRVRVTPRFEGGTFMGDDNHLTNKGTIGAYQVCAYSIQGVPEGQDMHMLFDPNPPGFTPSLTFDMAPVDRQFPKYYINIPGGACNQTVSTTPTVSELTTAGWWPCGDFAFDVNFGVYPPIDRTKRVTSVPTTRLSGPVRVGPGTPVESGASKGTLLTPGSQQTMLGSGSSVGNGGSGASTMQQQAITAGTVVGGVRRAGAPPVGASQTMSATVNSAAPGSGVGDVAIASTLHTENNRASMTRTPAESTSSEVNFACAKDPTFRVLGINGSADGVTMVVGHQYTISGCSFGNVPNPKAPKSVSSPAQITPSNLTPPQNTVALSFGDGANVWPPLASWSDNSIVVTIPYAPEGAPGTSLPVKLTVVRPDKQFISKDGFKYQIPGPAPGPPPASVALAVQSCTQDNTFRITGVYPTYGSGPASELRADAYYTIAGCAFGTAGGKSGVFFTGGYGPYGNYVYGTHYGLAPSPRSWSDTQIVIFIDQADLPSSVPVGVWPSIVEGDAYPLTVSIVRADGTQVIKPGFTFLLKP